MEEHEICDAIHRRRRARIWYRGGYRVVEPHAFGVGDGGGAYLRAYQVSGHTHSAEQGWKLFHLEEIEEFKALEETFAGSRAGYMRNDPNMTKIYCEL